MLGKKQSDSKAIGLADVKDILSKRSKEADFGYEQQTCLDYANKMCKLTVDDYKALEQELAVFEELKPDTIIKIADILPPYMSTLKLILAKDKITIDDSKVEKIMALVLEAKKKEIAPPPVVAADEAAKEAEKEEEKERAAKEEKAEKPEKPKKAKKAKEAKPSD